MLAQISKDVCSELSDACLPIWIKVEIVKKTSSIINLVFSPGQLRKNKLEKRAFFLAGLFNGLFCFIAIEYLINSFYVKFTEN